MSKLSSARRDLFSRGGASRHDKGRAGPVLGAAALGFLGGSRAGWLGLGLGLAGGFLAYRCAKNHLSVEGMAKGVSALERRVGKGHAWSRPVRVVQSVTVEKPRAELYSFWRDFENLPRFMYHLERVTKLSDRRSHWVAKAPAGQQVEWDAEIDAEVEGERIAWRSAEGSDIVNAGVVTFKDAPGDRGTEVTVDFRYHPPGGQLGRLVAKLFHEEPEQQVRSDLRRFKQLMEAGEITEREAGGKSHDSATEASEPARSGKEGA